MDEVQEYLYNRPIDGKVLIDKKIKKALTEEQFAAYQVIEAKRLKQQQEMMERMRNRNRQGGQRPGGQRPAGQRPAQQN